MRLLPGGVCDQHAITSRVLPQCNLLSACAADPGLGFYESVHGHIAVQTCLQVWLAIYNILTGVESRSKALASSACCSAVLRLRPLLTDILMDQLPVLKDLRRMLEELMIGCMGPAREPTGGCLIIEQVPRPACSYASIPL